MFWLQEAANKAAEHAEEAEHDAPIVVQLVNQWFGEYAYRFEMHYTKPLWDKFLGKFGSSAEAARAEKEQQGEYASLHNPMLPSLCRFPSVTEVRRPLLRSS